MRSISRRMPYQRSSPTQQLREAANAANRTQILSPANEQYENRSKLLRYHYKRAASNASVTNSAVTLRCFICQNSEARSDEALQTLQTLHILE